MAGTNELISMTDYVLKYAHFLKQPLELWMFVPCDENDNVLEEPEFHEPNNENKIGDYDELRYNYRKAKERCLFENFIYDEKNQVVRNNYGIEIYIKDDLIIDDITKYNLKLTK